MDGGDLMKPPAAVVCHFQGLCRLLLLLLLLFGLWVIADRLEPCVVPTRRCRFMTVTADLRSWAPSYKTRPTYYLSARPDGR